MSLAMLIIFLALMGLGAPIGVALGLGSIGAILIFDKYPVLVVIHKTAATLDSYVLLAIPFFLLAGQLMNTGGITTRLLRFASSLVGHIHGGLGHANIVANMIMAGMSGSAVADAAGLGKVQIKAMTEEGYSAEFSAAVTAAAATIGPIIPPSIPMVLYGAMAEVSVGALFLGGFVPGVLLGIALMILVYMISVRRKYPRKSTFDLKEVWASFKGAFLPLLSPAIIIGGILGGIFTPTEAAVIATVYSFALGFFVYKELHFEELIEELRSATVTTATILLIIGVAGAFSWVLAVEGVPQGVSNYLLSATKSPVIILVALNVILLIMGMFMESLSILVITVPFITPLVDAYGFNPVHIGVMVVLNLMIGLSTPPVGLSLFVCAKIGNIKLEKLYREIVPFLYPLIIVLFLIAFIPSLVTFLPNLVLKR